MLVHVYTLSMSVILWDIRLPFCSLLQYLLTDEILYTPEPKPHSGRAYTQPLFPHHSLAVPLQTCQLGLLKARTVWWRGWHNLVRQDFVPHIRSWLSLPLYITHTSSGMRSLISLSSLIFFTAVSNTCALPCLFLQLVHAVTGQGWESSLHL